MDSSFPRLLHSFDDEKSSLIQVLRTLKIPDGSRLSQALKLALDEHKGSNALTGKKNLIIMLDKKPSKESYRTIDHLKDVGVKVLFVVFGNELSRKDIKDLEQKGKVLVPADSLDAGVDGAKDIVNSLEGFYITFYTCNVNCCF